MKKYTHAWISLKAIEYLFSIENQLGDEHKAYLKRFLKFISTNPNSFLRGTWFPDTVIKDNIQGGHTWKYEKDDVKGKAETKRPPAYLAGQSKVQSIINTKVTLDAKISDLPDRCEALSQQIRDSVLIMNTLKKGDTLSFNNSQIALLFQMLSHYVADANMPLHCDNRDFYDPSKIHEDIEGFWEDEILKYYTLSKKYDIFDLTENNILEPKPDPNYKNSFLSSVDTLLAGKVNIPDNKNWRDYIGSTNNNIWDFLVSICYISFLQSITILPLYANDNFYDKSFRIMDVNPYKDLVTDFSAYIISDAIKSVAFVWLATWERWELLEDGIR